MILPFAIDGLKAQCFYPVLLQIMLNTNDVFTYGAEYTEAESVSQSFGKILWCITKPWHIPVTD